MSTRVTERDLRRFAAVGFPTGVAPADAPSSSQELLESVARVLEAPSARLVKAAVSALVVVADRDELLPLVHEAEMSAEAHRRLGYLAARLAEQLDEPRSSAFRELSRFLTELRTEHPTPLTLTAVTSNAYLRRLQEHADEISRQWGVFGDVTFQHAG